MPGSARVKAPEKEPASQMMAGAPHRTSAGVLSCMRPPDKKTNVASDSVPSRDQNSRSVQSLLRNTLLGDAPAPQSLSREATGESGYSAPIVPALAEKVRFTASGGSLEKGLKRVPSNECLQEAF